MERSCTLNRHAVNAPVLQKEAACLRTTMAALMGDDLDDLENLDEDLGRQRRFQGANAGPKTQRHPRDREQGQRREEKENSSPDMMGTDKVKAMGINNHEMRGVQDWVTARDDENWLLPEGAVCINVTHSNLNQKC